MGLATKQGLRITLEDEAIFIIQIQRRKRRKILANWVEAKVWCNLKWSLVFDALNKLPTLSQYHFPLGFGVNSVESETRLPGPEFQPLC